MRQISFITVLFLFLAVPFFSTAQNADEILQKVDQLTNTADDVEQDVEIVIIDQNGNQQNRKAIVLQKGSDKRILKFTAPASKEGIGFLSLPDDVMYMYMPAYNKERRIASSLKNQKFAGTDLTYDDLEAKNYSEEYDPTLTKTVGNIYVLELIPKSESDFSKVILKVNKTTYMPVSAHYYDKGNNKVKSANFTFVKKDGHWYTKTLVVKDLKTNHTTIMRTSNVKFNQDLSDYKFSIRYLKY